MLGDVSSCCEDYFLDYFVTYFSTESLHSLYFNWLLNRMPSPKITACMLRYIGNWLCSFSIFYSQVGCVNIIFCSKHGPFLDKMKNNVFHTTAIADIQSKLAKSFSL
jgi:hypothetical protein